MKKFLQRTIIIFIIFSFILLLFSGITACSQNKATSEGYDALDSIQKNGKIIIATSLTTPPLGYLDENKQPGGYDVDLGKAIAKELGVEYEVVDTMHNNRIPFLTTKKVDVVVQGFSITPERAKAVSFTSHPYAQDVYFIMASKDKNIKGPEDLKGLKLGVGKGLVQDIYWTEHPVEGMELVRFEDDPSLLQAMLSNKVDAMANSMFVQQAIIKENSGANFELKFQFYADCWGLAVRQEDIQLLHWLDTFLFSYYTTGKLQDLWLKHFGYPMLDLPTF